MKRIIVLVVLLIVLMACGGSRRPPFVPPPLPPPVSAILRVEAFDGEARVADAAVDALCEPGAFTLSGQTDAGGLLEWRDLAPVLTCDVTVRAEGFAEMAWTGASVASGLTTLDFHLERLAPPEPPKPPRPTVVKGRLGTRGREFIYADSGESFGWRGATGFQLLDYVADGNDGAARDFLAWAADPDADPSTPGFTVLRILAMAKGLFQLSPEDGRRALPRLFELAADADIYVQIVALADTKAYGFDRAALEQQVDAIKNACLATPVCILEVANEPYHPTQADALHDIATVNALARRIPASILHTAGTSGDDEAHEPQGMFVVRHLDRGRTPWQNQIRRVRELEAVALATGKPTVNSEPIGIDEVYTPGKQRIGAPEADDVAFAMGALSLVFRVYSTYHFQDGLFARRPRPVQQQAAISFLQGATLAPAGTPFAYRNAGHAGSPVRDARFTDEGGGIWRAYSGLAGGRALTVVLRKAGANPDAEIEWAPGWNRTPIVVRRDVVVYELRPQ